MRRTVYKLLLLPGEQAAYIAAPKPARMPMEFLLLLFENDSKCNRLPDLAYYPVSLASALPSYVSDTFEMSHGLRSSGSTFMYLYHLISIDLQSSCSFIPPHCKAYSYEPGSHHLLHQLLSNQSTTSFKKSLLLPYLQYLELLQIPKN